MNCNIIRDLLPSYIDGLTSEESRLEIVKHLQSCAECQKYYDDMQYTITDSTPVPEPQGITLFKSVKLMKFRIYRVFFSLFTLLVLIGCFVFYWMQPSAVPYDAVQLQYHRNGNQINVSFALKDTGEIYYTGTATQSQLPDGSISSQQTLEARYMLRPRSIRQENEHLSWSAILDDTYTEYWWKFTFSDCIVVIRNGELWEIQTKGE